MQLTITLTKEQLYYLLTESSKQQITKEEVIQQLLDIQIELQKDLEADYSVDLWNTIED